MSKRQGSLKSQLYTVTIFAMVAACDISISNFILLANTGVQHRLNYNIYKNINIFATLQQRDKII